MSKFYLENIAIVGAGGNIGSFIAKALIATGKHKVTALTRPDSNSTLPEGLHAVKKVVYDEKSSLVDALKGQDFLIVTMGVTADQQQSIKLFDAAKEAGVQWIMPSEWGVDSTNEKLASDIIIGNANIKKRQYIESIGLNWISITCSFWYEFSLAGTEVRYGFNFHDKKVTFFDDGKTKIPTTTWPRVGNAVAKVLSLPLKAQEDGELSLGDFKDQSVLISSFLVSQRDMFDSVLRVTGTKESDWTISHEDVKERFKRGQEMLKTGDVMGFGLLLYSRVFFPEGDSDYTSRLDNEKLGLPKEDLDEYTNIAVKMAEKGNTFDPRGNI